MLLRFFLRFFVLPAQLGESHHLVCLPVEVEVVHPLLIEVDDLSAVAAPTQLSIVVDGDVADDAFVRGLASEDIDHTSKGAAEMHLRLFLDGGVCHGYRCAKKNQG